MAHAQGFDLLWVALALVLVIEGLLPFLNPSGWRAAMQRALQLSDGQIRFFGLVCLLGGTLLAWLAWP